MWMMLRVGLCGILCTILMLVVLRTQVVESKTMKILVEVCLAMEIINGLLLLIGIAKKVFWLVVWWILSSCIQQILIFGIFMGHAGTVWKSKNGWVLTIGLLVLYFILYVAAIKIKKYSTMLSENREIPPREGTASLELGTMDPLPRQPTQISLPTYESLQLDPPSYESIQRLNNSGAHSIYIISKMH